MNKIKKIIEYGLYLLVFLLPLQTRWIIKAGEINGGYWEYGTLSLYATDVLLIVVLSFFIVAQIKKQNFQFSIFPPKADPPRADNFQTIFKFLILNYWLYIALIDLSIIISIFFAADKVLAVYKYGMFLLGIGLFWLIVSAEYNKIKLVWSLIVGAALEACLGIWQFATQSSFASKWLGIAAHNPAELGTSVVETMGFDGVAERWLRAYGGLDHPNILGGFLAITLLLLIILYIDQKPEEREKYSKIFNFKFSTLPTGRQVFKQFSISKFLNFQTVFLFFCFFVFMSALFFTFSRGAWAGFLAGLVAMLTILLWRKNKQAMKKTLELVVVGAAIILLLFNLYSNLVLTRLSKDTRLEIKSNTERLESYSYAKQIIKKHWLFGVGIGNYTLALKNEIKSLNYLYQGGNQPSYFYQPVHNVFLLVWAETGILGLAGFLGFIGCLVFYFFPFAKRESKRGRLATSIIIALIAMMFVDHWFWSLHFGILFLWLVSGLIALDFSNKECYNNEVIINKK